MSGLDFITTSSVLLGLGAAANLILVITMAHTWKYWRQVKWYVIVLIIGNIVYLTFNMGFTLIAHLGSFPKVTSDYCKFVAFVTHLGECLIHMSVAALAIHVLLTSVTGSQGNRTRHAVVISLFVLLSLPVPLSKVSMYSASEDSVTCMEAYPSGELLKFYVIGSKVAVLFFPLAVTVCACVATLLLNLSSKKTIRTDVAYPDLVLAVTLGVVVAVCSVPFASVDIATNEMEFPGVSFFRFLRILMGLYLFSNTFPLLSAIVCVIFEYVVAFRSRGQGFSSFGEMQNTPGERTKLVN